jgi:hypothetical protein
MTARELNDEMESLGYKYHSKNNEGVFSNGERSIIVYKIELNKYGIFKNFSKEKRKYFKQNFEQFIDKIKAYEEKSAILEKKFQLLLLDRIFDNKTDEIERDGVRIIEYDIGEDDIYLFYKCIQYKHKNTIFDITLQDDECEITMYNKDRTNYEAVDLGSCKIDEIVPILKKYIDFIGLIK